MRSKVRSPGTIPTAGLYLELQTALEQSPEEGWGSGAAKRIYLTGGPTPQVWRATWSRTDGTPFLRLIRMGLSNASTTDDHTLDLRVVIFGIGGCGCGK